MSSLESKLKRGNDPLVKAFNEGKSPKELKSMHAKSKALENKKKGVAKKMGESRTKKKEQDKEDEYQHFLYINGLEDDGDIRKRQMG